MDNPSQSFLIGNELVLGEGESNTEYIDPLAHIHFNDRFDLLSKLVRCVAGKHANGLFIAGPGGTGKTYTVLETLQQMGLVDGTDYCRIAGYSTPGGLYETLFNYSNRLVVFDDCDSILKDPNGLNILKSVLDTLPVRTVTWRSSVPNLPDSFAFTGQVVFISNLQPDRLPDPKLQALLTRVFTVVINGTRQQILDRMVTLVPRVAHDLTPDDHHIITEFLQGNVDHIRNLSFRYLVNLVSLYRFSSNDWQSLSLMLS